MEATLPFLQLVVMKSLLSHYSNHTFSLAINPQYHYNRERDFINGGCNYAKREFSVKTWLYPGKCMMCHRHWKCMEVSLRCR